MKFSISLFLTLAIGLMFLISGCDDDPMGPGFTNDYSTVPPLADYADLDPVTTESGSTYYIIEEGSGEDWVEMTSRYDESFIGFLTVRNQNGDIFQSTYANGNENPQNIALTSLYSEHPEGFLQGIFGMREGEHRVVIVPLDSSDEGPVDGDGNDDPSGDNEVPVVSGQTLVYEIEVVHLP